MALLLSLLPRLAEPNSEDLQPVTVAVIDTGLDLHHAYFRNSIWANSGEQGFDSMGVDKATNGIDDDLNGFIDDSHGWNFCSNRSDLQDKHGHGTHIAGIIQTQATQNLFPAHPKFMILKYDSSCANDLTAMARAINYALDMGAQIINISGGGFGFSRDEMLALKRAQEMNVPIVSASGNKLPGQRDRSFFPAAYNFPNIYSVVATDNHGHQLPTSNINPLKKNLFAVGKNIVSTLPGNRIGEMSGTSQAAAHMTGLFVPQIARRFHTRHSPKLVSFYSNPKHSW